MGMRGGSPWPHASVHCPVVFTCCSTDKKIKLTMTGTHNVDMSKLGTRAKEKKVKPVKRRATACGSTDMIGRRQHGAARNGAPHRAAARAGRRKRLQHTAHARKKQPAESERGTRDAHENSTGQCRDRRGKRRTQSPERKWWVVPIFDGARSSSPHPSGLGMPHLPCMLTCRGRWTPDSKRPLFFLFAPHGKLPST